MTKPLAYLVPFLLLPILGTAQKAKFEFYTTADGLAGNFTHSITQDGQGFIWVLNDYKLHRFDGRNLIIYPPPPAELPGSTELSRGIMPYEDSLLLITAETYLFLLHPVTGAWQSFKPPGGDYYLDFHHIVPSRKNDALVYVHKGRPFNSIGIRHFRGRRFEPAPHPDRPFKVNQNAAWLDNSDNFYLFSYDTLFKYDNSGRQVAEALFSSNCSGCFVSSFQMGPGDELILLTKAVSRQAFLNSNGPFFIMKQDTPAFRPHPVNRFVPKETMVLLSFISEKDGSIWACGNDRNLIYYDAGRDTLYNYQEELKQLFPNTTDLFGLFQNRTGTVWAGSRLGLLKVTPQVSLFDNYFTQPQKECDGNCSFRGLAEDSRGMLYGSFYHGLVKFSPGQKEVGTPHFYNFELNPFGLYAYGDQIWLNNGQLLDSRASSSAM